MCEICQSSIPSVVGEFSIRGALLHSLFPSDSRRAHFLYIALFCTPTSLLTSSVVFFSSFVVFFSSSDSSNSTADRDRRASALPPRSPPPCVCLLFSVLSLQHSYLSNTSRLPTLLTAHISPLPTSVPCEWCFSAWSHSLIDHRFFNNSFYPGNEWDLSCSQSPQIRF